MNHVLECRGDAVAGCAGQDQEHSFTLKKGVEHVDLREKAEPVEFIVFAAHELGCFVDDAACFPSKRSFDLHLHVRGLQRQQHAESIGHVTVCSMGQPSSCPVPVVQQVHHGFAARSLKLHAHLEGLHKAARAMVHGRLVAV